MTTVAFDGVVMAADTLAADGAGLKSVAYKIFELPDCVVGASGDAGQIANWVYDVKKFGGDKLPYILQKGYPTYNRDTDNNCFLVVSKSSKEIWVTSSGGFIKWHKPQHAIGSGRDFALAAMYLGRNAPEAVSVAKVFDVFTGGEIQQVKV